MGIKKSIRALLDRLGWEIRRKDPQHYRATVERSLLWLASHGFEVKTVLDVGASNGCWSKRSFKAYPDADYLLFEPQPVHHADIDRFSRHAKQNVVVIKKAVGSETGHTFFDATDPFGGALASEQGEYTIRTEMTTIDSETARNGCKGPYLLKLDTHGFEKAILEGAAATLKACSVLIIEAYNYRIADEAMLFWELCGYLGERGFRPVDMVDLLHRQYDDSLWQMDIVFVRSEWKGFNYLNFR